MQAEISGCGEMIDWHFGSNLHRLKSVSRRRFGDAVESAAIIQYFGLANG
jgi:hypothetical protein